MKTSSFKARFKRRFGEEGEKAVDVEETEQVFSMDDLKEKRKGEKLPFVFVYKDKDYAYDPRAIRSFDSEGRPIIEYYIGNFLPIVDQGILPNYKGKQIWSEIVNKIFDRGEMTSAIRSSQQEPQKFDRTSLILGSLLGLCAGALLISMIVLADPHLFFPYGLPALPVKGVIHVVKTAAGL